MYFPNLPTDNLYKFIAISGLILIFLSTVLPLWVIHNIQIELIANKEESDLIIFEGKLLENEIKRLEKRVEYLEALSSNKKRESIKLNDQITKEIEKAKKTIIDINKRRIQIKIQYEKVKYLFNKVGQIKFVIFTGNFIGIILTYYGFSLWYKRLQKYQDQIVKNEAQKQLENNSKKE